MKKNKYNLAYLNGNALLATSYFSWYFIVATLVLLQGCKDDDAHPAPTVPLLLSYETTFRNTTTTVVYSYNAANKVSAIVWNRTTGGSETKGSESFIYDDAGRLKEQLRSITGLHREKIVYTWDEDRISVASTYTNDDKKIAFSFYKYNGNGQLESAETYHVEGSMGFLRTDSIAFTYHPDENLFQMFHYAFVEEDAKMVLVSTKTFADYLASPNPVALVEILPNINLQKKLPTHYTLDGLDGSLSYTMNYKFRFGGYPIERTVTSSGGEERTVYTYQE